MSDFTDRLHRRAKLLADSYDPGNAYPEVISLLVRSADEIEALSWALRESTAQVLDLQEKLKKLEGS